jgi:hypothetical protein
LRLYVRFIARNLRFVIPTAGLRPPLLRMCVSASQKALFFRQANAVPCTRSGERKPPVQYLPHANSKRANSPHCRCRRGLQPTVGLRPPLLRMCVSASQKTLFFRQTNAVPCTRSGGRKPPCNTLRMRTRNGQTHLIGVADAVCYPRWADVRGADESARNCNRVTHTHGGLTPAAPGGCALLRCRSSYCSVYPLCTWSGWRRSAVVREKNVRCET